MAILISKSGSSCSHFPTHKKNWNGYTGRHARKITAVAVGEATEDFVLVSGSMDGAARLWDAATGVTLQTFAHPAINNARLVAYWRLDEFAGPRARDSSAQTHDGIYEGDEILKALKLIDA